MVHTFERQDSLFNVYYLFSFVRRERERRRRREKNYSNNNEKEKK